MDLEIEALKQAAAWPGAPRRTGNVLASLHMITGRHEEGFAYFSGLPQPDATALAIAG
ncbi:MAG: hypothetical protein HOY71_30435, partial [Nonomuraea sp.]|nr:hypothetical protein [Nonomuraea sp.]